jgi:UDP-N-acetylglucosamine 2-epimerase
MRLVSIVGARPEFVQAVCLSRALAGAHEELIVHTGQHYDYEMSRRFFEELPLPTPRFNLDVGPGTRAAQLALMLARLEKVLVDVRPDAVLVRGDTTSTLAGALAASQLDLPLVHVEAGERSYDRSMPEETSRVVTDQLADVHFCASRAAVGRLAGEGLTRSVHWVGDVMYDALLSFQELALARSTVLDTLALEAERYALVTIHRAGNVDDPSRLSDLVAALNAAPGRVVFPIHPRTRAAIAQLGVTWAAHVLVVDPVGYLDMLALTARACLVTTDSGGLQLEAYCLGVPCLTLRDETEWTETVDAGWNTLVGSDPARIHAAWTRPGRPADRPPVFGDGHAAERIVGLLNEGVVERAFRARPRGTGSKAVPRS